MFARELFEAPRTSLPLKKGVLATALGSYGALIAVMRPQDYLLLTTTDAAEREAIAGHEFSSLDTYDKGDETFHKNAYNMPFLTVQYPSGRVVGHEGRHRAAMVMRANGSKFPVMLFFRTEYVHTVNYTHYATSSDEEEGIEKTETFPDMAAARARKEALEQMNRDAQGSGYFYDIKVRTTGGNTLKGQPDRSATWKYAAWNPKDIPAYLIGQFDRSVKVATSRMAVGVVKGYSHYAKDL